MINQQLHRICTYKSSSKERIHFPCISLHVYCIIRVPHQELLTPGSIHAHKAQQLELHFLKKSSTSPCTVTESQNHRISPVGRGWSWSQILLRSLGMLKPGCRKDAPNLIAVFNTGGLPLPFWITSICFTSILKVCNTENGLWAQFNELFPN